MNYIKIIEPRWHDNTVLIAPWKVGSINQIVVEHHDFPTPYYMTKQEVESYPMTTITTKKGNKVNMFVVPISALKTDLLLPSL